MTTMILDPTDERVPIQRETTGRPEHITGTIGLLDIGKPRGNIPIDRIEELIHARLPGVETRRYMKPTVTKPAPDELKRKIAEECSFVIEALADCGSCVTCSGRIQVVIATPRGEGL